MEIEPHQESVRSQTGPTKLSTGAQGPTTGSGGEATVSATLLSLEVACDRSAPGVVRAALGRIDGLGPVLDDALLVASELVTNAVVHSGGSAADVLSVTVSLERESLTISVHDPGLSGSRAQTRPPDLQPHGWGLHIVQQLASEWGSEHRQGYRVWAELALAA